MHFFEPTPEELVRKDHPYRKLLEIIDFSKLCKPLRKLEVVPIIWTVC